jgi:hypothetical protein
MMTAALERGARDNRALKDNARQRQKFQMQLWSMPQTYRGSVTLSRSIFLSVWRSCRTLIE